MLRVKFSKSPEFVTTAQEMASARDVITQVGDEMKFPPDFMS